MEGSDGNDSGNYIEAIINPGDFETPRTPETISLLNEMICLQNTE